jgi:hypothetical protein
MKKRKTANKGPTADNWKRSNKSIGLGPTSSKGKLWANEASDDDANPPCFTIMDFTWTQSMNFVHGSSARAFASINGAIVLVLGKTKRQTLWVCILR